MLPTVHTSLQCEVLAAKSVRQTGQGTAPKVLLLTLQCLLHQTRQHTAEAGRRLPGNRCTAQNAGC